MKKLYFTRYLFFIFLSVLTSINSWAQSAYYYRSAKTSAWDASNTWESSPDGAGNWMPAVSTPTYEANTVTIRGGHIITITNSIIVDQLVVASGGVLELKTGSGASLTVNDGSGNDIIVQNGGIFKHNITGTSTLPIFNSPSAKLEIQKGGILEAANNNRNSSNYANTDSITASNIIWADSSIFNWNNTGNPTAGGTYFPNNTAIPIFRFSKTASIGGTNPTIINGLLEAVDSVLFQSSGKKTFRNGISGTGKVAVTGVSVGQFIINGTTAILGGIGVVELSNNGLLISPGTTVTLVSNKIIKNYKDSTKGTIKDSGTIIAGDYIISGNSKVQIDGTVKTSNVNGLSGSTNSTFATASGFTVNSATSVIEYNRLGSQSVTVPLDCKNLIITGSGTKTVSGNEDIYVSGELNIMAGNTFALNGTNHLKLNGGGTLNINIDAVFDNGSESQVSGGGTPTINIYGTFITRDVQGFTGTGTSIPGIVPKIFPGSTIEYSKAGDQIVTPRDDYKNITFSGSGTKTIPTCRPIGTVTIKDSVIADASNKTFGDSTTNLTMTGGRFKVGGAGTKPDIAGTYNLTGGVIEFTTSGLTTGTIRSPLTYMNIEVSGTNVGNSKGITTLYDGGSFTVKSGGIFENSGFRIDGSTGIQTFAMEAGAIFKTGVSGGFIGNGDKDSAALKNIENIVIDPKSTIVYNRKGNQIITPLTVHPALLLKGTGNKTVAGGTLTIAATADSVVIDTTVVFKVNSSAKVDFQNSPVFIRSSATSTGMIGEIADGTSALLNATNVTIERFIPARRSFRFLSPSVTTNTSIKSNWMEGAVNPNTTTRINPNPGYGTNITGTGGTANGFDPTITNNPSLFTFTASTQKWEPVANTNGTLLAGNAYRLMVRGDRSIDMTTPNNDPAPANTILRTKGTLFTGTYSPSLNTVNNSYTFIGNPYASPVDFNKMIANATTKDVSSSYYVWDPTLNVRGAYVVYNAVYDSTNNKSSRVDKNIQSGQAFFVQTTGNSPQINFLESNKSTGNTRVFRTPFHRPKLSVQLLLNLNEGLENNADGVTVFFDDNFSAGAGKEDSYKFTNLDENLAINCNGISLSMEGRPPVTADDTIPLMMWQFRQNNYYLRITSSNFAPEVTAFLKDAYLHKETPVDLSSVTLHPFTIDTTVSASFAKDRFSIIFKAGRALPVTLTNINAYQKDEGIQVEWKANTEINIEKYEVEKSKDGLHFEFAASVPAKNNNAAIAYYKWFDANANPGKNFYRIKIIEKSGEVKYSKIVTVNVSNENHGITISPNPIKGNIITLQVSNMEKGKYVLQLYNNLGQNMYNGTLKHTGLSATYTIVPARAIPKGVYRLAINKEDKSINKTIVFE